MRSPTHHKHMLLSKFYGGKLLSGGLIALGCTFSTSSFSQVVNVIDPVSNQTYKLADPAMMQTPAEAETAITYAETAGKALEADVAKERLKTLNEENAFTKAKGLNSAYLAGLDNFAKVDVAKYKVDLNNYTVSGTKYNELFSSYTKAALANNGLPAKKRKAATVAALNKQKAQIDAWGVKLSKWKISLDAAKAKLDTENAALAKQKLQSETAMQAATEKLKVSKKKLQGILDQLLLCSNYTDKCHALLVSKFNNTTAAGYFSTPAYKGSVAELTAELEKLKNMPGIIWDGK